RVHVVRSTRQRERRRGRATEVARPSTFSARLRGRYGRERIGAETKTMKDRKLLMLTLIAMAMIPQAPPAGPPHSFAAEYDGNRPVTLTGSVTKMAWINPHSWIYIDVKKSDGAVENWAVEAGPPGTLIRAGFTKESLALGTVIVVNGYRAKDGAMRANGRDITL